MTVTKSKYSGKKDFQSLHIDLKKQIAALEQMLEADRANAQNMTPEELKKHEEIKHLIFQLSSTSYM